MSTNETTGSNPTPEQVQAALNHDRYGSDMDQRDIDILQAINPARSVGWSARKVIAAEVRRLQQVAGAEARRWQDEIRRTIIEMLPETGSDGAIDGGGCDSSDPLDFSLAEICQGMRQWEESRDEARAKLEAANNDIAAALKRAETAEAGNAELREAGEAMLPFVATEAEMLDYASLNEGRAAPSDVAGMKLRRALAKTPADTGSELDKLRARVEELEGILGKASPLVEASHEMIRRDGEEIARLREIEKAAKELVKDSHSWDDDYSTHHEVFGCDLEDLRAALKAPASPAAGEEAPTISRGFSSGAESCLSDEMLHRRLDIQRQQAKPAQGSGVKP